MYTQGGRVTGKQCWLFLSSLKCQSVTLLTIRLFLRTSCQLIFVITLRQLKALLLYKIYRVKLCKFYTEKPCLSAVCCKEHYQFIIYTTHLRSVYVPKIRFLALLEKNENAFCYISLTFIDIIKECQQIRVAGNKGFQLKNVQNNLMKNNSTQLKIK